MSGFGRQRLNAVSGSDSEYASSEPVSGSEYASSEPVSDLENRDHQPKAFGAKRGFGVENSLESDETASQSDFSETSTPPNSPSKSFGAKKKRGKDETNDDAKKNKPRWEAVSTTVEIAEEDFKCAICLDFFKQPIETPCCRQAFCKSCLEKSANNHRAEFKCPFCNKFTSQDKLVPCSEFFMKCFNGMTVICTAEQCNEKFPYNKRMDHLNECKGIYECKFCDAKTQVKDNHKNDCIGYLQEKLKKMELLIQKNKETLKKKHDYLDRYNDGYGGYY